jgi:predicted alpha/beta hydrolase family esterase
MPEGYPTIEELRAGGWFPVPRAPLPFPSIVTASRNDPLGRFERVAELAACWGSKLVDLGEVGHLNPASGYGEWPEAEGFIRELAKGERGGTSRADATAGVKK